MAPLSTDKFSKCGELYRSPKINDKQFIFLSCIYCKDISWQLDTFLQHLDSTHHKVDEISLNFYKVEAINDQNETTVKNAIEPPINYSQAMQPASSNCENDPLDENHYSFSDLLPEDGKIEKGEMNECGEGVGSQTETKRNGKIIKSTNKMPEMQCAFKCDEKENSCDEVFERDKITTEDGNDENTIECNDEESASDDNADADNIAIDSTCAKSNNKLSLKHLTKNREFIKCVINAYRKQNILWDSVYKTKKSFGPQKQNALKEILNDIKEMFEIPVNQQQIESIIKRLKLRFTHHLRLRDKGESHKPLWFFEFLKFLEPHLNGTRMKSSTSKQLDDNQLDTLIKLVKENECFWNENNIHHTSILTKQEILKRITGDFSKLYDLTEFNVDIMQNSIDEIIEMAREENKNKMEYLESKYSDSEYKSSNKFYKKIEFLLPHVGPFKCKYCLKIFNDIYAYKFHISRHEGTKPFKCMQCPRELTHKKEFVCHLRRHTKECPFQCSVCDKSFPSQKEWHRHFIKHGSKPYVCELCADSFYTQHQLTNHMKNHNNIKDHVCPECGKGFTHRGLLRQHLQTHNKTKCFCTLCDNTYSNPRSLRKHYVRVHESGHQPSVASRAQYNCQICKITFSTIQDAKQHRKEHKQSNPTERKHVCEICGHNFAYPRNLADHKKTHSNIRDQICDICGKAFTNANLLNQHKNVHTGEKFVCKACGKDYAHYRGLCRHISKVHSTNIRDLDALLEKQKTVSTLQ